MQSLDTTTWTNVIAQTQSNSQNSLEKINDDKIVDKVWVQSSALGVLIEHDHITLSLFNLNLEKC